MRFLIFFISVLVMINIACNDIETESKEMLRLSPLESELRKKIGGCGESLGELPKTELSINIICESVNLSIQHVLYSNSSRHLLVFVDERFNFIHIEPDGVPQAKSINPIQNHLNDHQWGVTMTDFLTSNPLPIMYSSPREFLFHNGIEIYLNQCFHSNLIPFDSYSKIVREYVTGFYNYEEVETEDQLMNMYEYVFSKTFNNELEYSDENKAKAFEKYSIGVNHLLNELKEESEMGFPIMVFHRDTYEIVYVKLHVLQSCSTDPFYSNLGNNYFYALEYVTILHPEYYLDY
ncbi:MAG: hypothetical protein KDC34_13165 [Saprospiraceae bacterium]|nr:hypothetical protein [Saprospiraceae bacterium]